MRNIFEGLRQSLICVKADLRKWIVTPRVITAFVLFGFLEYRSLADVNKLAAYYGVGCSPWVFPFSIGHATMGLLLGAIFIMFYCNAPFTGSDTNSMVIRMGRRRWITGQVLYIAVSAFIISAFYVVVSILTILPSIEFTSDWGELMYIIAGNDCNEVMRQLGINIMLYPRAEMMDFWSPFEVMALGFVLLWLHIMFIAYLIMAVNIAVKNLYGAVAAGFLVGFQYFSAYVGWMFLGPVISYLSPLSWVTVNAINWTLSKEGTAGPEYVFPFLIISIAVFIAVSVVSFCRKDIEIEKGEF